MLKAFDGHVFKTHGILTALPTDIGGKTISIDAEVINVALDYNILLGCTWFYAMKVDASTIFWFLHFPYQGKIVTINQLDSCMSDLRPNANSTIPLFSESASTAQSIGEGMFKDPCLIGVFPLSAPDIPKIAPINMISSIGSYDPWVIPLPSKIESLGDTILLSLAELSYSMIQSAGDSIDIVSSASSIEELNQYLFPRWAQPLSLSHDLLNNTLPLYEAILKVMTLS